MATKKTKDETPRQEEQTQEVVTEDGGSNEISAKYLDEELSDREQTAAEGLQKSLRAFLKSDFDIETDEQSSVKIPTGLDILDAILGGGYTSAFSMIVGMPGTGKTALAVKSLAAGQRRWPGLFVPTFIDSEEVMTSDRLAELDVNQPRIKPINDVTVEKVFKVVEAISLLKSDDANKAIFDVPCAIVWDSIANTHTEKGLIEEDMNKVTGQKAKLLSHYLPKYVKKLNKYGIALISINQLRDNISIGNVPKAPDLKWLQDKKIPGGKSALFNAAQLLFLKPGGDLKETEYPFRGFQVKAQAIKNKFFAPHIEVPLIFSFERGFSNFWTNWNLLKEYKRVKVASWCSLPDMPTERFRQNKAGEKYMQNAEFRKYFDQYVEEVIQTEFIEKHRSKTGDERKEIF